MKSIAIYQVCPDNTYRECLDLFVRLWDRKFHGSYEDTFVTPLPDMTAADVVERRTDVDVAEQRVSSRLAGYHTEDLRVEPEVSLGGGGWTPPQHSGIGAKLVDVSDTGMGLQVLSPLHVGSNVHVSVILYRTGTGEELKARARVVHCLADDDELYRVGLDFLTVDRRNLDAGYVPDLDA